MRSLLIFGIVLVSVAVAPARAEDIRSSLYPRRMRVAVAVTDLRKEPSPAGPDLEHDPLQESQLLYGELVRALEEKDGWARVEAVEQPEWSHNQRWEGYPGWVELSHLTPHAGWQPNLVVTVKIASPQPAPGTLVFQKLRPPLGSALRGKLEQTRIGPAWKLAMLDGSTRWISQSEAVVPANRRTLSADDLRKEIVRAARLFIGTPYYWGGRSAHDPLPTSAPHTGVDCSGLTGLAYQAGGLLIPRDAHEQWMRARPIPPEELQPADLVFLADEKNPNRITHVMLTAGDGRVVEGPGTDKVVREILLEERLKEAPGRKVYYGTYLSAHPEPVEG